MTACVAYSAGQPGGLRVEFIVRTNPVTGEATAAIPMSNQPQGMTIAYWATCVRATHDTLSCSM